MQQGECIRRSAFMGKAFTLPVEDLDLPQEIAIGPEAEQGLFAQVLELGISLGLEQEVQQFQCRGSSQFLVGGRFQDKDSPLGGSNSLGQISGVTVQARQNLPISCHSGPVRRCAVQVHDT